MNVKCPRCSAVMQQGTPQCPGCGVRFQTARAPAAAPKSKKLFVMVGVAIVAVIGLVFGAIALLSSLSDSTVPKRKGRRSARKQVEAPKEEPAPAEAPKAPEKGPEPEPEPVEETPEPAEETPPEPAEEKPEPKVPEKPKPVVKKPEPVVKVPAPPPAVKKPEPPPPAKETPPPPSVKKPGPEKPKAKTKPKPKPPKPRVDTTGNAFKALHAYLASPDDAKRLAAEEAALAAVRSRRPRAFFQAVILSLRENVDPAALKKHLESHKPHVFGHATPGELDVALQDALSRELFWIGRAYLSRWISLGGKEDDIAPHAASLKLKNAKFRYEKRYGTAEGLAMAQLAEAQDLEDARKAAKGKVKDKGALTAHAAIVQLRLWSTITDVKVRREEAKDLENLFRRGKVPESVEPLFRGIADRMRASVPCTVCRGTGGLLCKACKEGWVPEPCRPCKGTGTRDRNGTQEQCGFCDGRKVRGNRIVRCRACDGTTKQPCADCGGKAWSGPAIEELLVFEPCVTCRGRGHLLDPLRVACPDCLGIGERISAPAGE